MQSHATLTLHYLGEKSSESCCSKACSAGASKGLTREHVAQRVLEKEKSLIQTLNHVLGKMGYEFDAQSRFQAITSMEK